MLFPFAEERKKKGETNTRQTRNGESKTQSETKKRKKICLLFFFLSLKKKVHDERQNFSRPIL